MRPGKRADPVENNNVTKDDSKLRKADVLEPQEFHKKLYEGTNNLLQDLDKLFTVSWFWESRFWQSDQFLLAHS